MQTPILILSSAVVLCASLAQAQTYPARPLRLVVASAAGATTDIVGRIVAQKLSEGLGHGVGVDNRPGAGGNIAAEMVSKSPPDGYTLLLGFPGLATNPSLYPQLAYDPQKDLAPISLVSSGPLLLVVHPSLPAMLHVPYKSFPQALIDLSSGRISLMINAIPGLLPYVKAGKLRGLAITSARRTALLPELPTVIEAGLPGYEVVTWNGILVAAATPQDIVQRLNVEIGKALKAQDARDQFINIGFDLIPGTPAQFAAYIREETASPAPSSTRKQDCGTPLFGFLLNPRFSTRWLPAAPPSGATCTIALQPAKDAYSAPYESWCYAGAGNGIAIVNMCLTMARRITCNTGRQCWTSPNCWARLVASMLDSADCIDKNSLQKPIIWRNA